MSEVLEPESSGCLETMIGFSTETGRDTASTPSSSSGTQALSNPTLGSSESSRPPTPPMERRRPPPVPWPEPRPRQYSGPSGVRPGTAKESPAALASDRAAHSHAAAGGPPLPGQSTAALAPAPSSGGPLGPGRPQDGPVNQPADNAVLQMLIQQMQQQQEQQQQQMQQQQEQQQQMISLLQNLGLQSRPAAVPPGPVERPPPHSPPPPSQDGRPVAHISGSSWVAQDLPRQADICRQCERQEPHICPYSEGGSDSAGSFRRAEVAVSPPGRRPPPGAPHLHCPVTQWVNSESEAARPAAPPEQLLPGEAAAGPSQHYAGSVVSSITSRHEVSVHSALRKLQRAIEKMKLTKG